MKNKINDINNNICLIKNSLRMIIAKKSIEKNKIYLYFFIINIKLYLSKLKKVHKKRMTQVNKYIINKAKEKIVYNEYNNLWNKLNPFFIRFLTTKKHNEKMKEAKKAVLKDKYVNCIKIMQYHLLIKKVEKRKEKIRFLYNFSSSKIMSKYWINLIKNILIIQKYIKVIKDKNNTLKNINNNYFGEDPKTIINEEKEIEN